MSCKICHRPLYEESLYCIENAPRSAQYLPEVPGDKGIKLDVAQCSGCGLVQLRNEPVGYWREEKTSAGLSDELASFRKEQFSKFRAEWGKNPDFTSFNRLEHMPEPNQYLQTLEGTGIIEVPNFEMMVRENIFYEFIVDHLYYFDQFTLFSALSINGFDVISIDKIWKEYILSATVIRREPLNLAAFDYAKVRLVSHIDTFLDGSKNYVIYGASHQALTLINMLNLNPLYVVDDVPEKQMKFTPGSGIPIIPPHMLEKDQVDAVIVMCGSYSFEVANKFNHPKKAILTTIKKYPALLEVGNVDNL